MTKAKFLMCSSAFISMNVKNDWLILDICSERQVAFSKCLITLCSWWGLVLWEMMSVLACFSVTKSLEWIFCRVCKPTSVGQPDNHTSQTCNLSREFNLFRLSSATKAFWIPSLSSEHKILKTGMDSRFSSYQYWELARKLEQHERNTYR